MAAVKIADLYAQVGVKVDASKLRQFMVLLVGVKTRVNQLTASINNAQSAIANSFKAEIQAQRLRQEQYRTITQMYNQQAAAARAAAAQSRIGSPRRSATPSSNASRTGSPGLSASSMLSGPASLLATAGGVYGLTSSFVAVNQQMDSFRAGLLLSSDGAEGARQQFDWLHAKAEQLGTDFRESTRSFMSFSATTSAMGATQDQTQVMYGNMLKIQSALAMTPDDAEGMSRALSQMLSKGKVMSEELKGQLAERVPGAVSIMAKAMGKTIPELFAAMEAGTVNSADAVPKFLKEYAKMAETTGALDQQKNSLAATLNRLRNSWTDLMTAAGDSGLKSMLIEGLRAVTQIFTYLATDGKPVLKEIVFWIGAAIAIIGAWADAIKTTITTIWELRGAIAAAAIAVAVFYAIAKAGSVGNLIYVGLFKLVMAFTATGTAAAGASVATNSLMLPLLAVAAIAAGIYLIWQDLSSGDSWLLDAANSSNIFAYAIQGLYNWFTKLFEVIADIRENGITWPTPPESVLKAIEFFKGLPGAAISGAGSLFNSAAGLLPSQGTAAGAQPTGNTNNNSVTIGTYNAAPGDTPAKVTAGFNIFDSSLVNAPVPG